MRGEPLTGIMLIIERAAFFFCGDRLKKLKYGVSAYMLGVFKIRG
jgi:hypothetical protein